jgi:hypothetical protein
LVIIGIDAGVPTKGLSACAAVMVVTLPPMPCEAPVTMTVFLLAILCSCRFLVEPGEFCLLGGCFVPLH